MATEVKIDPKTMRVSIAFDLPDKETLNRMVSAVTMVLMTMTQDGRGTKLQLYGAPPAEPENPPPSSPSKTPGPKKPKSRSPQPVAVKTK